MDPRGQNQGLARYASHMLQFKPGRDVALLNAMLNVIVAEGMVDIQYVQAHTEGFESLKAKVKDFTPEAMEPVCGIPAATIREVARLYARSERSHHLLGHGHLAAHPRHRQRALPDRARARHRPDRPARAPACIRCAARTTCRAPPTPA